MKKTQATTEQRACIEATVGRTVVIAGPGSGKTHTLIARIAAMVDAGTPSDSFCVVTYSNRAARDLVLRLDDAGVHSLGYVGTIHGLAWRVLELGLGLPEGLRPRFTIWDRIDQNDAIESIVNRKRLRCNPAEVCKFLERHHATTDGIFGISPSPAGATTTERELNMAARAYEAEKSRMNVEDFGGLVSRAVRLLVANHGLAAELRGVWPNLAVDEFQDVDAMQNEFLHLIDQGGMPHTSSFVVGDPLQSLYSFRHASPDHLMERARRADQVLHLTENFRSGPELVRKANELSQNDELGPARMHSAIVDAGPPAYVVGLDPHDTAALLTTTLARLQYEHNRPFSEVAVLARTNKQLDVVEFELAARGIPSHRVGEGRAIMETEAARVMLAYLRTTVNPNDRIALGTLEEWEGPLPNAGPEPLADRLCFWLSEIAGRPGSDYKEIGMLDDRLTTWHRETYEDHRKPAALLRWLSVTQIEDEDEEPEGVALSTFHASKGLEWTIVAVVGLVDAWTPGLTRSPEAIADERRALYVAITRAKSALVLTWPHYGKPTPWSHTNTALAPSRFLAEMGVGPV